MQCLGLGFKRETQAPEGGKGKFYEFEMFDSPSSVQFADNFTG